MRRLSDHVAPGSSDITRSTSAPHLGLTAEQDGGSGQNTAGTPVTGMLARGNEGQTNRVDNYARNNNSTISVGSYYSHAVSFALSQNSEDVDATESVSSVTEAEATVDPVTRMCSLALMKLSNVSCCRAALVQGKALMLLGCWLDMAAAVWSAIVETRKPSYSSQYASAHLSSSSLSTSRPKDDDGDHCPSTSRPVSEGHYQISNFSVGSFTELYSDSAENLLDFVNYICSSVSNLSGHLDITLHTSRFAEQSLTSNYSVGWIDAQVPTTMMCCNVDNRWCWEDKFRPSRFLYCPFLETLVPHGI